MGLELILLPLIGALALFVFKGEMARKVALAISVVALLNTIRYFFGFHTDGSYQYVTDWAWITSVGVHFKIGLDGAGLLMVFLTNLLIPIIIATTLEHDFGGRDALFYGLVLAMQAALVGVFMSLDGLLFYMFWELALIPIYFISAIFGGENRVKVTLKFFIYTFSGSLLMLLALIAVYLATPDRSFDLESLYKAQLSPDVAPWVLAGFFLAFAVKIPVFPFHTWQPDTYTTAPYGGTMLLAGIMLKMGLFGMMRWMLPMAVEAFGGHQHLFMSLAIIGIVYASVIAIQQDDLKRLVAYSSIGHVGLIAAGILAANEAGFQGALIQMLNHGINVIAMFYIVNLIEQKTGTRSLKALGGLAKVAPKFAVLFMIVLLANVALPLTNGFVGEFLLLSSVYQVNAWMGFFAGLTIILSAVYMFRIFHHAMFGKVNTVSAQFKDLNTTELTILGLLSVLILGLGVFPQPVFDLTAGSVTRILAHMTSF
jgi:NADH-quinone oxidoreductase subunit M